MEALLASMYPVLGRAIRQWSLVFLVLGGRMSSSMAEEAGPFRNLQIVVQDAAPVLTEDSLIAKEPHPVSRALAAALAVTLGPFGAHRLYLGTTPKVPLLYGLTFGGFGVLVLIDLGHILFTKDLSAYQDSRQVLMWARPHNGEEVTPP